MNDNLAIQLGAVAPSTFTGMAQKWWASLLTSTQRDLSVSWPALRRAIPELLLGARWYEDCLMELDQLRFREGAGNEDELPAEYMWRKLDLRRILIGPSEPALEVRALMESAPKGWRNVLDIDTIPDTTELTRRMQDRNEELLAAPITYGAAMNISKIAEEVAKLMAQNQPATSSKFYRRKNWKDAKTSSASPDVPHQRKMRSVKRYCNDLICFENL